MIRELVLGALYIKPDQIRRGTKQKDFVRSYFMQLARERQCLTRTVVVQNV